MKPSKEDLLLFIKDRKGAAKHFGVSEKTICRWMKSENLYESKANYGVKLNMQKAQAIRKKFEDGIEIKELAKEYQVTFSAISRIIQNRTYREIKQTANVSVTYNLY